MVLFWSRRSTGGHSGHGVVIVRSFLVYQFGQNWSENRFRVTLIKTSDGLEIFLFLDGPEGMSHTV